MSSSSPLQQEMTTDALEILKQAIHAVDPAIAVERHFRIDPSDDCLQLITGHSHDSHDSHNAATATTTVKKLDSKDFDNIVLIAFGKASSAMAAACVQQFHSSQKWKALPLKGICIVKDHHCTEEELQILSPDVQVREASHPVPDQRSVQAARDIRDMIEHKHEQPQLVTVTSKSLVLCCISGGGSALFCHPKEPLTLQDLQQTNQLLLASGLDISDMNVIRKRLEWGKGGQLATALPSGATMLTLVLSDILGDPLDLIASGPTVPDLSTPRDAWQLVQSNHLLSTQLPTRVFKLLKQLVDEQDANANADDATATSELAESSFDHVTTALVGNNELAVLAAAKEAEQRGYHPIILSTTMEGEARHVAGVYTAMAHYIVQQSHRNSQYTMVSPPAALIAGGETTVTLSPNTSGKGGRNQELALAAALQLYSNNLTNVVLASIGTDGTDGPTDAAGAVVHSNTFSAHQREAAEDALANHNAYPFFAQQQQVNGTNPLIMTGPTGTNVADVCVTLIR